MQRPGGMDFGGRLTFVIAPIPDISKGSFTLACSSHHGRTHVTDFRSQWVVKLRRKSQSPAGCPFPVFLSLTLQLWDAAAHMQG